MIVGAARDAHASSGACTACRVCHAATRGACSLHTGAAGSSSDHAARALDAVRARRGEVSLLVEFRTMLRTPDGALQLVELQSYDEAYPLYGEVLLNPPAPLAAAIARRDGRWGIALDPVLAERLSLAPGARAAIGAHQVEVRALIQRQPDRSLRADWRGPPALIAADALPDSELIGL